MDLAGWLLSFSSWAQVTVGDYGYFGVFLVTLVGNLSVFLPLPGWAIVFAAGAVLNPWLVGFAGGVGSALGELSSYAIGRGGGAVLQKRKDLQKVEAWVKRRGFFPVIIFVAATPLPFDDLIAILAGIVRYDLRKFILANIIGKFILATIIAFAGLYAMEWVLGVFA
ncbi:MAG: VTT domain-containing protein [Candidatus Aenigmarchaeota archaeon]|nr:VTT domain-containing protein [Candidatus Aenigmarchaeota archaeon]